MRFLLIGLTVFACGKRPEPTQQTFIPKDLNCNEHYIASLIERSCMPCHEPGNGRRHLHHTRAFKYYITDAMTWSKRGHGNPPFTNKELWEIRCWYYGGEDEFE